MSRRPSEASRLRAAIGWLSVLSCVISLASIARAQEVCVPVADGVPGQPGPPAWWSGGIGPMDDPRWQGAMSYGHVNDYAQMRALRYTDGAQKYLVLSWDVKFDNGPQAPGEDFLYVGFWDRAASRGNIIKIERTATTTVTDGGFGAAGYSASMFYRDSGTAGSWANITTGSFPNLPGWMQTDALLDATCIAGPPPLCTKWSLRLRVPIGTADAVSNPASGLPVPDAFDMWYELHVENAGPTIVRYKWPSTAPNVFDFPTLTFPDPDPDGDPATDDGQWEAASAGAATCAPGVSIQSMQITTDNTPNSTISTVSPNVFHARATNNTGGPINGNQIRARFRIANWGTTLFDSPTWSNINPSSPSCAAAMGTPTPVADGSDFDLTCTWTLTPEQQCQYRPADYTCTPMPEPLNETQCLLVELGSTTEVLFSRASACTNMDFEGPAAVPALSEWGLSALMASLLLMAIARLNRRTSGSARSNW